MIPKWSRLDNAAKIYPAAGGKSDTHVFRFSCDLTEPVDPVALQTALDESISVFPVFQYVMKRGLFWYYLEDTDIKPVVREEYKPPCSELYRPGVRSLLYEVTYYGVTINLEVYHVLTDGTGAVNFLRILITKYLSIKNGIDEPQLEHDASHMQLADDSFHKYYNNEGDSSNDKRPKACTLHGQRISEERIGIIRGTVSVKKLLEVSREHGATITTFMAACMLKAINEETDTLSKKRPIVLSVPVNLRNFFESASARNFFANIYTDYDFSKGGDELDDIIAKVNADFKREITLPALTAKLNFFCALESNIFARLAPLIIKDFVLKRAYHATASRSTAILSNVGVIRMPDELTEKIEAFAVCTGTNRLQACVCSYLDRLAISFTSPFISTDIQRRFFRELTSLGVEVEIAANRAAGE